MAGKRALSVVLFLMCVAAPWLVPQPERSERLQRVCDCAKPQQHHAWKDSKDSKADWSARGDHVWNM